MLVVHSFHLSCSKNCFGKVSSIGFCAFWFVGQGEQGQADRTLARRDISTGRTPKMILVAERHIAAIPFLNSLIEEET